MSQRTETLINGLVAEFYPDGILISGKTFDSKDALKALGGLWSPPLKKWKLPLNADLSTLTPQIPHSTSLRTATVRKNTFASRSNGTCCAQCKTELDMTYPSGPLWYVCPIHGKRKSSYTGD